MMNIKNEKTEIEFEGINNAKVNIAAENTGMEKFHAKQGHGFAAEQANTKIDLMQGKDAAVVGGDNAKNGADRLVDGVYLQNKYCKTAYDSVNNAFENHRYRYYTADGQPMKLEVPSDQYEAAVHEMEKRISRGEVAGIKDPQKAKEIISKGHVTYDQAVRISKAGTIDSLIYDAANGVVYAANAFGVSATITFALSLWRGDDLTTAIENSLCVGLQVGGVSFVTNIIVSQLNRAGVNAVLETASKDLVKLLGKNNASVLAQTLKQGSTACGSEVLDNVAKLLKCNIITDIVVIVVLSSKDISNAFKGRISGKQLFKNVATITGGALGTGGGALVGHAAGEAVGRVAGDMIGGEVGAEVGAKVVGKIGTFVGGAFGGAAGAKATNKAVSNFVEDDAVHLTKIIENEFTRLAQMYMLSEEEVSNSVLELQDILTGECLMDMYASPSQKDFGADLADRSITKIIAFRSHIIVPAYDQMLTGLALLGGDYRDGKGLFGQDTKKSTAVQIGEALTGRVYSEKAAGMGLYAAKQINAAQTMAEQGLYNMKNDECRIETILADGKKSLDENKNRIDRLLSEGGLDE